jgi:putative ABC transport system permease protein
VFRVALKDLMARKRRLVTTSIAVVLGIAFLTGTQLLSATLSDSIESLVGDVYKGVDAVVRSPKTTETPFGQPLRTPVPASTVTDVQAVDGVKVAQGVVEAQGNQLVGKDGKVFGGGFGPPTITYNWIPDSIMGTGGVNEGRGPESDDEIAIDSDSADAIGASIGDPVKIATLTGGVEEFTLVGTVGLGEDGKGKTGAKPIFFTTAVAQQLSGQPDQFNYVVVRADQGLSEKEIADRLAADLPDAQVITGSAFVKENQEQISQFVDILSIFVSVFGYIALFVAIFIIYNTFSIIVQQRTRETALLRAVGARRRQVLGASLLEAVIVGLIASVLGLIFGVLIATGLVNLMKSFFTVSGGVTTPNLGTFLFAVVVGIGITVVSALAPAFRSSRIPPIAALSEVSIDRADLSWSRKVWGVVLLLIGGALIGLGLADIGPNALFEVGGGAVLVLVSVALVIGPTIASPISRLLAVPFGWIGGISARLAGENAARNPKRTASTAAALTIGVTLVTLIAIIASSIKESSDSVLQSSVQSDYVVANASVTSLGAIPPTLNAQIDELSTVEASSPMRFGFMRLLDATAREKAEGTETTIPAGTFGIADDAPPGDDVAVLGVDPATIFEVLGVGDTEGSPSDLTQNTMAVQRDYAEDRGWKLGDTIPVYFGATGTQELTVALIFDQNIGQGNIWLPLDTFEPNQLPLFNSDFQIFVMSKPGVPKAEVRSQLEELVKDLPTVTVQDLPEYIEAQTAPIDTFLAIIYGLLGLAILIALIGIANTLSLSILERTRELGLLRAVGMSRKQLRRSVRYEAAIIAVFGALMGLVLGIAFSGALTIAIADSNPGIFTYHLPVGQLVIITIVAALAGVLAAILPARRAAKLDVLQAIAAT